MRTLSVFAAAVIAAGAGIACTSPNEPESRFATLQVAYTFVPPPGPAADPIIAGSCAHHNAPANLRIRASWTDETVMFQETSGSVHRAELQALRGGDYWITFADIRLCQIADATVVPSAVTINDVMLTRTPLSNGTLVFRFSVGRDGSVEP